jgi:hypothetical protein
LAFYQLSKGHPDGANIAPWAAGLVAAINSFYFASKGSERQQRGQTEALTTMAKENGPSR